MDTQATYRILLIEDDSRYAQMIQKLLTTRGGFELCHADRLSKGLERLSRADIDLVILDLFLPDAQGLTTFDLLHARAPDVPIVVLTGMYDDGVAPELLRHGVQDYLLKSRVDGSLLERSLRHSIERKYFEKALRSSETLFRTLIENNADGLIIVDRVGVVRFANPAALKLFNTSRENLLDALFGFPAITGEREEIEIRGGPGMPAIAEMRAAEIEWEGERAWLVSVRDISGRKQMEQDLIETMENLKQTIAQLEAANHKIIVQQRSVIEEERVKVLLEMAGATLHELNQPLTALLGNIEILSFEEDGSPGSHLCLEEIERAGKRIAEIVRKMQSVRQYETSPMGAESFPINLEQQIKILSVEDSDKDFAALYKILSAIGSITAVRAATMKEAMQILRQGDFDLALFDYDLPDGNALNGMEWMRRENLEIPIVILTGKGNEIIASRVIQEGAYDYLPKSRLSRASLTRSIASTLGRARLKKELRLTQEKLREMAIMDELTGLCNRRYFLDAVNRELARDRRYRQGVAVGMIDIDYFKNVNDSYGHAAGDLVLRELGRMLRERFRVSDICCRWGGEEFAVLLPNCRAQEAWEACERLREEVAAYDFCYGASSFQLTISAGIAEYGHAELESPTDLIERADEALYQAKSGGRNRVLVRDCLNERFG